MDASGTETIPQAWDDRVDPVFFRITSSLFSPEFCLGASVLLAGNDVVTERPLVPVRARR